MKLAFWRHEPDARPDPDVELRLAQAKVARLEAIAAEHKHVAEQMSQRLTDNHISEALGEWWHARPRPAKRIPWSNAS